MKNNWRQIVRVIIIFNSIFLMLAVAPFGFLFPSDVLTQTLRVIVIFLSTILLLYLVNDR